MFDINLFAILLAALIAVASPGPATLALAGTAMASGRKAGLALAAGITTGSLIWSVTAALGLGTLMLAHAWMLEVVRYVGAGYLLFLAFKAARSASSSKQSTAKALAGGGRALYAKGLMLHLTNPKAILFFGALYSLGVPQGVSAQGLALVVGAVGLQSALVFHGYALAFSTQRMGRLYVRMRRWFEGVFALAFGLAGLKILTATLR
jgi:threonine efflux protein